MTSNAKTVEDYLHELPLERREPFIELLDTMKGHIPEGFELVMQYGMPSFVVPHSRYPQGYHCEPSDPLPFVSLGNQKQGINLYHMGIYADAALLTWFEQEYPKHSRRKLDMGKSCIRFRGGMDIPLELIGELMEKISVQDYVERYEAQRRPNK